MSIIYSKEEGRFYLSQDDVMAILICSFVNR